MKSVNYILNDIIHCCKKSYPAHILIATILILLESYLSWIYNQIDVFKGNLENIKLKQKISDFDKSTNYKLIPIASNSRRYDNIMIVFDLEFEYSVKQC